MATLAARISAKRSIFMGSCAPSTWKLESSAVRFIDVGDMQVGEGAYPDWGIVGVCPEGVTSVDVDMEEGDGRTIRIEVSSVVASAGKRCYENGE